MLRNYFTPGWICKSSKDPGETNLGVTKRVYEEHGGTKDMKDLTVEDVADLQKGYWDKMKGDELPQKLRPLRF